MRRSKEETMFLFWGFFGGQEGEKLFKRDMPVELELKETWQYQFWEPRP